MAMSVVVLRALGHLRVVLPALRALDSTFPRAAITLATTPAMVPVAWQLPGLDHVVEVEELGRLPDWLAVPDLAVNLQDGGPRSHRLLLHLFPDRLVAFRHPDVPASSHGPDWDPTESEVTRWCRLLEAHGIPADPRGPDIAGRDGEAPPGTVATTVVSPGAKVPTR